MPPQTPNPTPVTPAPEGVPVAPPAMQAPVSPMDPPKSSGSKLWLILVGVVLLLLLVGGGLLYYINSQKATDSVQTVVGSQTTEVDDLNKELQETNPESIEGDLQDTDKDVSNL